MTFKYEIGHHVKNVNDKTITGRICARTQYEDGPDQYLVAYSATDGRTGHDWWPEPIIDLETPEEAQSPDFG